MTTWPIVELGKICEFKYGKSLPESKRASGNVSVYGSNGVIGYHNVPLTSTPTIIIGRKGSFGEVHFSDIPCWPIDTTYYVDESATDVDLKWLAHVLPSLGLKELNRAAAVPGLNRSDAYRRTLLLPPLAEQHHIAETFNQVSILRAKYRQSRMLFDDLISSSLYEMFGDLVTNSRGWPVAKLSSIALMTSGGTPSRSEPSNYGGTIPWVKSGELHVDLVINTKEKLTGPGLKNSSAKLMPVGTVLIAMYGATAGAVSLLGIEAATNQAICSVIPGPDLNCHFLVAVLQTMNSSLLSKRSGGAQPNLSQGLLRSLLIPLPPLELQKLFAEQLQEINSQRNRVKTPLIEDLIISLQAQAFAN